MGSFFSACKQQKSQKQQNNNELAIKDPEVDMVDRDGKTYLKYIMNYDSIPYFIPQIKYAKVTDIRPNYTIVVAARFPNNDSPIYRFPIKLKNVYNEPEFHHIHPGFESNLHNQARDALFPLICSTIVELRDVENCGGMLHADVYFNKGDNVVATSVSKWLVDNKLALKDID